MKKRVLFLCTHNSARSQMAEGLLRNQAGDRFEVFSAGTEATRVHPLAIVAMRELGIDINRQWSKNLEKYRGEAFDYVITVCDRANETCPVFPGNAERIHWSFEDPSAARGSDDQRLQAFRKVRDEIARHLRTFERIASPEVDDARRVSSMSNEVRLRDVEPDDLGIFYEQQLDADAARMAGFRSRDRAAFDTHWATNVLGNATAVNRTILVDGQVAGNICSWPQDGVRLVGYWIGKEHWGKGVATRALAAFLQLMTERPLYAHVAEHNAGSIRVLEKCGFSLEHKESVEIAGKDLTELVLVLR